jgi:hypothetical protein
VVLENDYPTSSQLVIYEAFWQSVAFTPSDAMPPSAFTPLRPGMSSDPLPALAASPNTAYVVLAPGWDPASAGPPTTFILLQSRDGFALQFNHTLDIPVDDSTFAGDCLAGSTLSQTEADFMTERVFQGLFAGRTYDAATCTTASGT